MPSTVILSFEYDEARNELIVCFTTGRVYVYSLVPPAVVADFRGAFSKGAFFNRHIRDKYPFRKGGRDTAPSLVAALKTSADR